MIARPWPKHFRCFVCDGRAVVRIFSGIYGGGFPACIAHQHIAADAALKPLADDNVADGYTVSAFAVVADDDYPRMGRTLWTARKRSPVAA